MKNFKRITSLVLALVMLVTMSLSMAIGVSADEEKGSITIDNAVDGETYKIYRILVLESYSGTHYAYTVAEAWADFFAEGAPGADYVDIENGYVTWKSGTPEEQALAAREFAAKAIEWATENSIAATQEGTANDGKVEFAELDLGYYLVSSSLGTLCSLDTTHPDATIYEKNSTSTFDKGIEIGDETVDYASYDIGSTVNFKLEAVVAAKDGHGADYAGVVKNFMIVDTMDQGLTYTKGTLKVYLDGTELPATVTAEDGSVTTNYTLAEEDHGFTVDFTDGTITNHVTVTVKYDAVLNGSAELGSVGNTNTATLTYGENQEETSTSKVFSTKIKIFKYDAEDETKGLPGAVFVLKNADGKYYKAETVDVIDEESGEKTGETLTKVTWVETEAEATKVKTDSNGDAEFVGIKAGTYSLEEIEAPTGYNKLPNPVEVTIAEPDKDEDGNVTFAESVLSKIENKSGVILPSTGGIGTTLFIVFGSLVAVGAAILLVTRRRMSLMAD